MSTATAPVPATTTALAGAWVAVLLLATLGPGTAIRAAAPTLPPVVETINSVGPAGEAVSPAEARFAAFERRLAELADENLALRQQVTTDRALLAQLAGRIPAGATTDAPATRPVPTVTFAGKETKLTVGGLAHVFGEIGGAPDSRYTGIGDRFQLRRLRVSFTGTFAEDVTFKMETDFGNAAIAGNSGSRGQLTDAFVAWTKYPALKLQVGQFKTPFGYDQLVADSKTLFVERTLANDRLTVGRQIGAMATGDLFGRVLNYSVGIFNGAGVNSGANDNNKFMSSGRLAATLFEGKRGELPLRWTVATNFFNTVDKGAFTGRRTGYGADTQLLAGPAELGFEWLRNDGHPVVGLPTTGEGWYTYTAWNLTRQWQALLRLDHYDSNTARPDTTTREWTYGVTYFLKGDDLKLSLNYVRGEQPAPAPSAGRLLGRVQVVF